MSEEKPAEKLSYSAPEDDPSGKSGAGFPKNFLGQLGKQLRAHRILAALAVHDVLEL